MSPKSRFSLKRALFVCSILVVLTLESCADKIKTDLIVFKALDESLMNSSVVIHNNSLSILSDFENKMVDPRTVEKAKIWYPKAQRIENLSKELFSYIESLKADLKKEAGLNTHHGVESFREGDKNAVMKLFKKQGRGQELYDRLKEYRNNLLAVDPDLDKEFHNNLSMTTPAFDSLRQKTDFTKTFFDDIPTIAALALLSKFENNIRFAENKSITFFDDHAVYHREPYEHYVVFAAINKSYLKAGETAEISSAVGAFANSASNTVTIDGKNVPINAEGVAVYTFKTPNKPGKHFVQVEITYLNIDGEKKTVTKMVEYTVADNK